MNAPATAVAGERQFSDIQLNTRVRLDALQSLSLGGFLVDASTRRVLLENLSARDFLDRYIPSRVVPDDCPPTSAGRQQSLATPGAVCAIRCPGDQCPLDPVLRTLNGEPTQHSLIRPRTVAGQPDLNRGWNLTAANARNDAGTPVAVFGILHEIESGPALADTQSDSQSMLEAMVRSSRRAMFHFDPHQGRVTWHGPIDALLGVPPEDIDTFDKVLALVHPDERDVAACEVAQACDPVTWRTRDVVRGACRARRSDGTYIRVEVDATNSRGGDGTLLVGFVTDVTERDEARGELQQALRMESIGRLTGGIAHDFNNLLTIILGNASVLQRLLKGTAASDFLNEITAAAERAATLTQQLLTFSKGKVSEPEPIQLDGVIQDSIALLRRLVGEQVSVEFSPSHAGGRVLIDPTQLHQVLMNMAVNARDAMPGGGQLRIASRLEQLIAPPPGLSPGRYHRLTVSDNGTGMDAETRARIFEPFFTTKKSGGTGLGLDSVYRIVRQAGGRIDVHSVVGRGTTFTIRLPEWVDPEVSASSEPQNHRSILLVEDEPQILRFASTLLRSEGYYVLTATHAKEALVQLEAWSGSLDLLITDVIMPGQSGAELARAVRATRPDTRVLFVSGYTRDEMSRHSIPIDSVNFLQKPFAPDTLLNRVVALLADPTDAGTPDRD